MLADPVGRDLPADVRELPGEVLVDAEDLGGLDGVTQQGADELVVHRRPDAERVLLRGDRRVGDQPAGLRVLDQIIHEEQRRPFQRRVGATGQEVLVPGEQVVFPEVVTEPGPAGRPDAVDVVDRRGAPPVVGVVVDHPPPGAVLLPGGPRAADGQVVDQVEQGLVALAEVRALRRPVVHLDVDVGGVLAPPGGVEQLVPDALEVGRLVARPAAGDEQVAPELEVERRQRRVVLQPRHRGGSAGRVPGGGARRRGRGLDQRQPPVGRQVGPIGPAEVQAAPSGRGCGGRPRGRPAAIRSPSPSPSTAPSRTAPRGRRRCPGSSCSWSPPPARGSPSRPLRPRSLDR